MRFRTVILASVLVSAVAYADEFDGTRSLSTDDKAQIQADQDQARQKIDEKYKDDDSAEARLAKQRDYEQAEQNVLNKHGLSEKDYLTQSTREGPDERKAIGDQAKAIEDKRKADAEAAKNRPPPSAPEVVKGFDENHPLDMSPGTEKPQLDANGNPIPKVEKLNPGDDPTAGLPPPRPERPSRRASHRRHHRGE
jgi:hypothetical protein